MEDSETTLNAHLRKICVPSNRFTDRAGIEQRSAYIKSTLSAAGVDFRLQPFTAWGAEGENIIVSAEGSRQNPRKIVIGAHYDTVPFSPGANDNGSSVSCLLTLIEQITRMRGPLASHLDLCFWDMEEVGKKGSAFYVQHLDRSLGYEYSAIVLEMLGWGSREPFSQRFPLKTAFRFPGFYASSLLNLHRADFHLIIERRGDLKAVAENNKRLSTCRVITAPNDLATSERLGLCDSDHHSFWQHDIPAIVITDTAKYRKSTYHTPEDTWPDIDVSFIGDVLHWLIQIISSE